jgi:hypothetical protein
MYEWNDPLLRVLVSKIILIKFTSRKDNHLGQSADDQHRKSCANSHLGLARLELRGRTTVPLSNSTHPNILVPPHRVAPMAPSSRMAMLSHNQAKVSQTTANTSYGTSYQYATTTSRPYTGQSKRPSTCRPRTAASTIGLQNQHMICAITESRGISPTVGLAFVNLDTGEAALSQISDSQTYVRTINKIRVYAPSEILIPTTAVSPPSKLFSIIEEDLEAINADLISVDRHYYAETTGLEFIHQLAFTEDIEAIKISIGGNYFAVCCFAAVSHRYFPFLIIRLSCP